MSETLKDALRYGNCFLELCQPSLVQHADGGLLSVHIFGTAIATDKLNIIPECFLLTTGIGLEDTQQSVGSLHSSHSILRNQKFPKQLTSCRVRAAEWQGELLHPAPLCQTGSPTCLAYLHDTCTGSLVTWQLK